ncbi:MAG: DUF2726 domain-containing protein [Rhizorhabdus sp.]
MTEELGLLSVGSAILILCALMLARALNGPGASPTPIAKEFMTRREQAMLAALEQVLPMYRVHAQVAMGALLTVSGQLGRRSTPADLNAFSQKIVDVVIIDPTTGKIVALVELDDRTHDARNDRERDAMTARAGYQTFHIPASARPSVATALAVIGHLREASESDARDCLRRG